MTSLTKYKKIVKNSYLKPDTIIYSEIILQCLNTFSGQLQYALRVCNVKRSLARLVVDGTLNADLTLINDVSKAQSIVNILSLEDVDSFNRIEVFSEFDFSS